MALVRFPREGMCQSQETDAERIQGAYSDFTNFTSTHVSGLVVQNPPANAGDIRDAGSIPGSGRSPGTQSVILAWRISRREEPGGL